MTKVFKYQEILNSQTNKNELANYIFLERQFMGVSMWLCYLELSVTFE